MIKTIEDIQISSQNAEIEKQQPKMQKRIEWIDWIKAIGIFLVVIGHANPDPKFRLWIYSFHMPLFFLVSGATFNPSKFKTLKECVIAKIKNLIIPYLSINIFSMIFWYIYYNYFTINEFSMINAIKAILYGHTEVIKPINGPTWFLLTLFLSEILFYVLNRGVNGDKKSLINCSVLLILIGYAESITSSKVYLPWHIGTVPIAAGLVIIGYILFDYIKKNENKLKKIKIAIPIVSVLIGGYIAVFVNKNVSMHGNQYRSLILTFSSIFFTMSGITLLLMKIKKLKLLSFIGRNTLIILSIHMPIIILIRYYMPEFKVNSWKSTIIATIVFICLLPITYLIEKFMPFLVGNFKKYNKVGKRIIYGIMVLIIIVISILSVRDKMNVIIYKKFISDQDYVAHALGGIDGFKYTNSKEALENSYKNGFRIFEVDIKLTSDNELVCVHGWKQKDYEERLGIEYNKENPIMDYNTFMSLKIQGQYTPLSFKDLSQFIMQHQDIYVMIDIGNKSYEETKKIYSKIIEDCENNDKTLQRLITAGHTTKMIKAIKECYDFDLINLYWAKKDKREEKIDTEKEFVEYCKKNGISSLSVDTTVYTKDFGEYMKKNNIILYVFTENDEKAAGTILQTVDLVGTDFINIKN